MAQPKQETGIVLRHPASRARHAGSGNAERTRDITPEMV